MSKAATLKDNALTDWFGELPPDRTHCAKLCLEALHAALANYHSVTRKEWIGDDALICTCFGISEQTIEDVIQTLALQTVEQVTRACNAGGGCRSCQPLIVDLLEDHLRTSAGTEQAG